MIALVLPALLAATAARAGITTIITETSVVRVLTRRGAAAPPAPVRYRERHGPRCITAAAIAGAAVLAPDSVDLQLRGGTRMRARLRDECPALDYYRGFYIEPNADGRICADRDAIRTRSGATCEIDVFRTLTPVPAGESHRSAP